MRTRFCESYILWDTISQNLGIFFFEIRRGFGLVWHAGGSGRNAGITQKYKFNIVPRSFLDVLSCLSVGITLGIRLGHFRYGYSRLHAYERANQIVKRLKYQRMSRLVDCPRFSGRGSFLSPGRVSLNTAVHPRHPHSTLYQIRC